MERRGRGRIQEEKELALKHKEEEELRIIEENRRLKEWEEKFDREQKIKEDARTNCKEWLGKAIMSEEVIDALWSPMLKYPKNPYTDEPDTSRAPTLRVTLEYYDGKF